RRKKVDSARRFASNSFPQSLQQPPGVIMAQRTAPPFRADHVGSLLRPTELHEARAKAKRGEMSADALRALQDRHIREAVAKQESIGMQLVTDGEVRRDWWHTDFIHGPAGVERAAGDAYGQPNATQTQQPRAGTT